MGTGFFLLLAAMGFGRFVYPMLLPSMQDSLGMTYGPMGVLNTMNLIGYLAGALGGGVLATRFGAKMVVTGAMILVGVGMIALGLVEAYWIAFVIMLFAGIGTGAAFAPLAGLGRAWTPPHLGGFTMGFLSTGAAFGTAIASFFVPIILSTQGPEGWRQAWVYMGITALVLTIIGAVTLKERPPAASPGAQGGAAPALAWGKVFRNRTIVTICAAYFLFGFYQVYITFFIAYLRRGLGLPPEVVGDIWRACAIVGFLFLALWGLLSDRIGRKQAVALCMLPLTVGLLLPVFRQDIPFLYVSVILYGATFGGPMQIILAAAADAVPVSLAAAAVGLVTAVFGLGQAVSPAIAGYLIDLTGSFYPGFILSAVVMAGSLALFTLCPLKKAA